METEQKPKATTILEVIQEESLKARKIVADRNAAIAADVTKPEQGKAKPYSFKAVSVDNQGVIVLIGAAAGNIDHDDEVLQKAALLGMAYEFCASKTREFRANHQEVIPCELVASWPGGPILKSGKVLKAGEAIPENDTVVGINIEKGQETHWFVSVKPLDEKILDAARKGEIVGASWAGYVSREPVQGT
jgi:hypothetical protein